MSETLTSWRRATGARARAALLLALAGAGAGCEDAVAPSASFSCEGGEARVNGQPVRVAPNGFFTAGNQIVSLTSCTPATFHGVSRPVFSFDPSGGRLGVDTSMVADFARMRAWGANVVRIELAQYFWVPSSRFHFPGYADAVERAVRQARSAGLHVLLALQYSDRGDPAYPGSLLEDMHQPMADENHSVPFWREVATRFKDDGGVFFELYGEPYPVDAAGSFKNWDLWLNGGTAPADETYEPRAAFQAVGMQRLYDVVRETGADNLVVVSGTNWGYFLDGVPSREVRGYNVVYSTHPWDWPDKQPAAWERDWAFLARTHPVMISEFGNYDCREGYIRSVLDKADELKISWIAWAWQAPEEGQARTQNDGDPICEFPMLLTDWGGTPSAVGNVVKSRLATY